MIIIYFLFALVLIRKSIIPDLEWLEKLVNTMIIFVLIVGILQMLTVRNILPIRPILTNLIYNDITNVSVCFNKNHLSFYSTFMEPSFCGAFLVGAFCLVISRYKYSSQNVVLLCSLIIAIFLSLSSSAYGGLLICIAITVFSKVGKNYTMILVPLLIIGAILMYTVFYETLDRVIFSKAETSSYIVRTNWNKWALEKFNSNPYWGVGYGNSRASSLFYTILGELGIIGMLAYLSMVFYYLKQLLFKKSVSYLSAYSFMVIGVVICQFIASPDLNLSPFWMATFLYAAAFHKNPSTPKVMKHRI